MHDPLIRLALRAIHLLPQGEKVPTESYRLHGLLPLREKVPEGRMRGQAVSANKKGPDRSGPNFTYETVVLRRLLLVVFDFLEVRVDDIVLRAGIAAGGLRFGLSL
jgi:hypothetical protein